MDNQTLEIKATRQILKPAHEVFDAIVDPTKMTNYFISESTGKMEEGRELIWRFPEFDMNVPVRVGKIMKDKYISYYWSYNEHELLIEMTLEPWENNATVVTVTEKSMNNDEEGIKWLKGNTEGWANFLDCLKAWLEYGIHLRKGAFEFRRDEFAKK
jgi:uncharacterized protein YndB with AHSA1/START domain